jgi:S1-C subfamily serine protease
MMQQRVRVWAVAFWVLPLLAAAFGLKSAQAADVDGGKIYQQTLPSTVWVVVPEEKTANSLKVSSGTGSLIDVKHKLVLTNYHVVQNKSDVFVLFPIIQKNGKVVTEKDTYKKLFEGARIPGKVKCRTKEKDLALIELQRVPEGARAIRLAANSPSPGSRLHSIGNPGASGALWVYTSGEVRSVYTDTFQTGGQNGENAFRVHATIVQATSPTNPGDSGGPAVNNQGELVAVTESYNTKARGFSNFIDVSEVKQFLKANKIKLSNAPVIARSTQSIEDKPATKPAAEDAAAKAEHDAMRELKLAKLDLADPTYGPKARKRLQDLIKKYPNTKAAEQAKELLKK